VKTVFRQEELVQAADKVALDAPFTPANPEGGASRPTGLAAETSAYHEAREMAAFTARVGTACERDAPLAAARAEADAIIRQARKQATEECRRMLDEAAAQKEAMLADAEKAVAEARKEAKRLEAAAKSKLKEARQKAEKAGFEAGREAGIKAGAEAGLAETRPFAERARLIAERIEEARAEIIAAAKRELAGLALLAARKVAKTVCEGQREAAAENIKAALSKVKTAGKITVRVNLADLEASASRIDEFKRLLESSAAIRIVEDPAIEVGGCLVETESGEIDARISSQFAELARQWSNV
jgi:flagellar assembly protein FliH